MQINGQPFPSFGFGTYRTIIKNTWQTKALGIRVPAPFSSADLYVNGQKIISTGEIGKSAESEKPSRRTLLAFFETNAQELEILIHVSNFTMFKGGLRGKIRIGSAQEILQESRKYLAIDMASLGIIFAIMTYHFAVYFLTRSYKENFIFSILSFLYLGMVLFYGEQSILFFFPELPLPVHIRIGHSILAFIPPMILIFLHSLYKEMVHIGFIYFFAGTSCLFAISLGFPLHFFTRFNFYYFIISGTGSCLVAVILTWRAAFRRIPGAGILLAGFLSLAAFTAYSTFLYRTDHIAGGFVSLGFSLFALFQAGALASRHAGLEKTNHRIQNRLYDNSIALVKQRNEIEMNLHDSLGGNLTDLKLALQKILRTYQNKYPELIPELQKIMRRTEMTIQSIRTQLLFLEDLQVAMQDLVSGLRLILLRRYQDAGKKVKIELAPGISDKLKDLDESFLIDDLLKINIIMIIQELCTNNLKYETETSNWKFSIENGVLQFSVQTNRKSLDSTTRGAVKSYGQNNVLKRISEISGTINLISDNGLNFIELRVPLISRGQKANTHSTPPR
ncbi:MAG: hypothetical protein KDK38_01480 [Leptospiraceae bacterium]|nr:hypothetical protein [Leptospiraceae bacterium]